MRKTLPSPSVLKSFFQKDALIHELEDHRRWVERFMFLLGVISAIMAIPQMIAIYKAESSAQVSLSAWSFYAFAALMWVVYAVVFKMSVTKRVNVLYFLVNLSVVVMILMYR